MHHYYTKSRRLSRARILISDVIRGVSVEFYTYSDIFSAKTIDEGTRLLIETAIVPEKGVILDMGCGYGAIGITLVKAQPGLRAVLVDSNPRAIEAAKMNARLNRVEDRVDIRLGDLYEPVRGETFDAIISNPPLAAGWKIIEKLISEAPAFLKENGNLQLVFRKGEAKAEQLLRKHFKRVEKLARKHGYTVFYAEP